MILYYDVPLRDLKTCNQGKRNNHKFAQHNATVKKPVLFNFSEKQPQFNEHPTIKANL